MQSAFKPNISLQLGPPPCTKTYCEVITQGGDEEVHRLEVPRTPEEDWEVLPPHVRGPQLVDPLEVAEVRPHCPDVGLAGC